MVKVLLVGNGAREHALAEAIKSSNKNPELISFISAKNPGIVKLSSKYIIAKLGDFSALGNFVDEEKPDFAVIGPEAPLEAGIVDFLATKKIPAIGPTKELAQLETSKSFTREVMRKYGVPGSPRYDSFKTVDGISEFMDTLSGIVIKPDGLTGGKGVRVQGDHFQTKEEALKYCKEVLNEHNIVVVEDKLIGEEFSLQSFCDGRFVVDCPVAQDHKRAYDGDKGPNTGGMGSYSSEDHLLPFLKPEHVREAHRITEKMAQALYRHTGHYFKGIMYGGFILTKEGVKLIEYNCRFGDPEAMNVLPLLKTDFIDVCMALINGTLSKTNVEFEKKATVCKYAVPKGYPEKPVKNEKIEIGNIDSAKVYFASVDEREDGLYMLGSRAVAFVGTGNNLKEAEQAAQSALDSVKGPVEFRKDIGTEALIQNRINHIKEITGK
ncbi:phosphoribosylamine--glycine ligase [Candidatus Woesearchaeota archaeon]|nr:phosphoribosylamine--glycine ligase [Candidatus Woesearchaeota archaeon]